MRVIELDAEAWRTIDDVYDALLPALEAPDWHGRDMDALIDSMGAGSINGIEPPYVLSFNAVKGLPLDVVVFLCDLREYVSDALAWHNAHYEDQRDITILLDGALDG